MKTAIFTVIKNEHLYIEEWIEYHLNLGITHIFIFEDIDSETHKPITDKYPDVTLGPIIDVVDPKKKEETILAKEKGGSVQRRYIMDGLLYIASLQEYDWCFALDSDEYLTLTDSGDSINNVLEQFENYDAVILQWRNYGANGLVHMPDYSQKGVVDTYIKPCDATTDRGIDMTKVCYNMRTFTKRHFLTSHQPSNVCKWCRTDFSESRSNPVYDKIYIRHYITKSWEEYNNKLCVRGMFHKWHRKIEDFFTLNPDIKEVKNIYKEKHRL